MPGGRAQGALCADKPFLTSAIMELRVPQVRRLPVCVSRVDTTHKCLSLCEALRPPRPPIITRAIGATHAHSPSARSIGFCVIWVCISSSSSSIFNYAAVEAGLHDKPRVLESRQGHEFPSARCLSIKDPTASRCGCFCLFFSLPTTNPARYRGHDEAVGFGCDQIHFGCGFLIRSFFYLYC